jgi:cytochrome c biogenesis protein CcmG, thiol:disulfide interchange protein DsbE
MLSSSKKNWKNAAKMSTSSEQKPPRKFPWGQLLALVVVVAVLALVGFRLRSSAAGPVPLMSLAPEFTLTTFDGQSYHSADLRGKVVVINFWASWCQPCKEEAPELENTWRHYKDQNVLFLGIGYVDTETEALGYLKQFDITYPNGPDLGTRISQAYRIRGVPETYFIDTAGRLVFSKIGPTTQAEMMSVIEPLLKK